MSYFVRTLREVGEHFGKTVRTAQRWRRAGMPKSSAGFDLGQIEEWLRSKPYLGKSFQEMETEVQIQDLFDLAVMELRRGLRHLCQAFIRARGKTRQQLIDRAVRGVLHGCLVQASLLEGGELCDPNQTGPAPIAVDLGGDKAPH